MSVRKRVLVVMGGALVGASLQPIAAEVLYLFDEGGHEASTPLKIVITLIWYFLSLPGALVAGHGYWTMAFMVLCWGALGGYVAYLCGGRERNGVGDRP